MTHGEAWMKKKLQGPDLKKDFYNGPKYLPDKMKHEEAVRHYNTKLFAYWLTKLDDRLSLLRKKQIISALMFGSVEKYKLYEETKCGE